jgi:hypothetical protein
LHIIGLNRLPRRINQICARFYNRYHSACPVDVEGKGVGLNAGGADLRKPERGGETRKTIKIRAPTCSSGQVTDSRTATLERLAAGEVAPKIHAGQVRAEAERHVPDVGDVVANHDADQAGAVIEGSVPDISNAVGNYNVSQAGTTVECAVPDAGYAVSNRDVGQTVAISERPLPDAGYAIGNRYASQVDASHECPEAYIGYAVRNHDICQAAARA